MRILIDCFGGDNCPQAPIEGALIVLAQNQNINIGLVGDESIIKQNLEGKDYDKSRLDIIHASDIINNEDSPSIAIRRKKDSSMVVALNTLANGGADGVVSSGNTGALLAGASLIVKRLDGVTRASLSPTLPTIVDNKYTILVDGGANVDCTPEMLKEFAIMGSSYMQGVYGIPKPTVALLNNGTEAEKGNTLTKATYELLSNSSLNFVGNIEAKEVLFGKADVVVADGFSGNIVIKSSEGMANAIFSLIKTNIQQGGLRAKIGYLLLKPMFRKIKKQMSSDTIGGGVFLGIKQVVVKAHGSSNATAFANACLNAIKICQSNVVEITKNGIKD